MRLELEPQRLTAVPDEPPVLQVRITNTGEVISGYTLRVLGADPAWVHVDTPEPRLFPGESAEVTIVLTLPPGLPAGERRMAVQVRELVGEQATAVEELVLEVPGTPGLDVRLDPATVTTARRGSFGVLIENNGNTVLAGALVGTDPEDQVTFAFDPPRFQLSPGEHTVAEMRATVKRKLFGSPEPRQFELYVDDRPATTWSRSGPGRRPGGDKADAAPPTEDTPPVAMGVLVHRPVFSRGVLALVGLLLAISVFAVVITTALSGVVSRSAADRDLALQVAQARDQAATTGTSALAGQVLLLSTGEPVPGVTVEAFDEADTDAPLATTATDDDGAFRVGSLPAGSYKLRIQGAGFAEVWYPSAATDADAAPVEVSAGQTVADLTVLLGGVPATVSGTVLGDDVAGAIAQLELPLDSPVLAQQVSNQLATDPGTPGQAREAGAVVRSVPVGSDGEFVLTQVPSPGVYDLVVSKPGYSTQVQRIDVAAGEDRAGLEIQLIEGDGSISGHVNGTDGPIGGATVVATFGQVTVRTVTLTEDDVGAFTLRGLPTPGTFTVHISADGYAPATLSLNLGEGQQLTGVVATLGAASGTLAGVVTTPDGDAGGVTVTVTDGATTRQTVTQSTAPVGGWAISGLAIPSTYTVTFSRADLESQVVSVSIDGYGRVTSGAADARSVNVSMRSATGRLTGTVRQRNAAGQVGPAPNVQVTASSGSAQYTVTTASTPASQVGRFVLDDLPPGTYTVTFSRKGTRPTSQIVTLTAGQERRLDPVLVSPASVGGTVHAGADPRPGAVVNLYLAAEYGTAAPPVATTRTDDDGRFTFADVDAPAHYILEVRYTEVGAPVATSEPFTVMASDQIIRDIAVPVT